MSYNVSKFPQGTFSWADVYSTDIAATKKFMTNLLGWTSEDLPTGEGQPDYTMFYLDGKSVAGGAPTFAPNMPSFWASYISVDDVDSILAKVEDLGGKIEMPAMDVLDSGRLAGIQDPTGAIVNLWQPKNHIGAGVVNKAGAMCWNELYTQDVESAKKFFAELFNWTYETDETGYVTIFNNGRRNGGIFKMTEDMQFPPHWMVYFTVDSLDSTTEKVNELGGQVHMTKDIGIGQIGMIQDPAGAHFIVMEMTTVTPDEWEE